MSEELFNNGDEYMRFMRDNCEQCKFQSKLVYDYGDGENKTVYHCFVQCDINQYLCGEVEKIDPFTRHVCKKYTEQGIICEQRKVEK